MEEVTKVISALNIVAECHRAKGDLYFIDLPSIGDAWKLYKALKPITSIELDDTVKQYQDGLFTLTFKHTQD
jgi:hypothetical protein